MTMLFPEFASARRAAPSREKAIVLFAGGGGSSKGIQMAIGRDPDDAVNHSADALAMHAANHPATRHWQQSVTRADPEDVTAGHPVGLLWASPDCRHFSRAKGAALLDRNIRDLAWVVVHYAERVAPRVIMLENVPEFLTWCPLIPKLDEAGAPVLDKATGKPLMVPDSAKIDDKGLGETFKKWLRRLRGLGYRVEWRVLRACDYGAPTIRQRLFLIARRDGAPIGWPAPTHGPGRPLPWRTAAECIDWSIPCPSIFDRTRPLADATMARIFAGLRRFVLGSADPFIIPVTHQGDRRTWSIDEPLRTVTAAHRGEMALVTPWMAQHNTGVVGCKVDEPLSSVLGTGSHQALVTSHLLTLRNHADGQRLARPMPTVTAQGFHLGEVRAFLVKYYGAAEHGQDCRDPMHTVTARHRLGLVTVAGIDYQIMDIGMRMLKPRELFRAQSFPETYIIDPLVERRRGNKTVMVPMPADAQVHCCGNAVPPVMAEALVRANLQEWAHVAEAAE